MKKNIEEFEKAIFVFIQIDGFFKLNFLSFSPFNFPQKKNFLTKTEIKLEEISRI